jgi:hypothetical protein
VNKIVPGRKVRQFPDAGILIVSDDTVKSRPDLLAAIVGWQPQAMIVDEIPTGELGFETFGGHAQTRLCHFRARHRTVRDTDGSFP